MQRGGVAQQQHSSVFLRLVEKGVQEAGDTNEPESLPATCGQREVALCDPAQSDAGAVRGDARQRIRPQPEGEIRGRLSGWFGRSGEVRLRRRALCLIRGRSFFLLVFNSAS